ncbi:MAG: 4'-phosphopantetheinyl transferase superfamily protein [Bdellovibrionaceae bacterium]|nr:4'-phosphopantetheinyl transferase superfamily protein [Pseudobdellovibrionaceae bacterium]
MTIAASTVGEIRDLAAASLHCPELELELSPDFASSKHDYRLAIRRALATRLPDVAADLLDLERLPSHPRFSISISHGRSFGGYVLAPLPLRIGFDLEESARVQPAIADRIRHPSDDPAPSPAHLWVAKEAAFKCLPIDQQPRTSTKIVVQDWTLLGATNYSCRASTPESGSEFSGYGFITGHRLHLMCFFTDGSQLRSSSADRFSRTRSQRE